MKECCKYYAFHAPGKPNIASDNTEKNKWKFNIDLTKQSIANGTSYGVLKYSLFRIIFCDKPMLANVWEIDFHKSIMSAYMYVI